MNEEFLKNKIEETKRGINSAFLAAQKAKKEYYTKCGELTAYKQMLELSVPKLNVYTENNN